MTLHPVAELVASVDQRDDTYTGGDMDLGHCPAIGIRSGRTLVVTPNREGSVMTESTGPGRVVIVAAATVDAREGGAER